MFDLLTIAANGSGPGAGGAALGLGVMLLFLIVGIAIFIFWLWMLIHAIGNPALDSTMKIVWILVIIFLGIIGALVYFFVGKNKAMAASTASSGPPM